MPIAPLKQRIDRQVRRSVVLAETSKLLHIRARRLLNRALTAAANGRPQYAKLLAERSHVVKARAVRVANRARNQVTQVVHLRAQG
jgi:hypothetical protein